MGRSPQSLSDFPVVIAAAEPLMFSGASDVQAASEVMIGKPADNIDVKGDEVRISAAVITESMTADMAGYSPTDHISCRDEVCRDENLRISEIIHREVAFTAFCLFPEGVGRED